jgi:hypothetical protein
MIWESQDELQAAGVTQVPNPANTELERTWLIQKNVRASSEVRHHTITWTSVDTGNGVGEVPDSDSSEDTDTGCGRGLEFVRSLVAGDRIAIVARALVNHSIAVVLLVTDVFRSIPAGQIMCPAFALRCSILLRYRFFSAKSIMSTCYMSAPHMGYVLSMQCAVYTLLLRKRTSALTFSSYHIPRRLINL